MRQLTEIEIKVMRVLEGHRALDARQIASAAELSPSAARAAVRRLVGRGLVTRSDTTYSLDASALSELLEAAA